MKAPGMQVYWREWCGDIALRRCSWQAQGVLPHVMLLLHTSDDQYGVLRWPLAEIAKTAGVPLKFLRELADKNVLKGGDVFESHFVHIPSHAGKKGEPITLVEGNGGSCWFMARLVRDDWARRQRGRDTRFTEDNQPSRPPTRRVGGESVNGLASALASALDSSTNTATDSSIRPAEELALALRQIGYSECSAMEPHLVAAHAEGITGEELTAIAKKNPGKGIAYLVATARGKRADAAGGGANGIATAAVDPAVAARAEHRRQLENKIIDIRHLCDTSGSITPEERDKRIAEAIAEAGGGALEAVS